MFCGERASPSTSPRWAKGPGSAAASRTPLDDASKRRARATSGEGAAAALSGRTGPPHPALRADLSPTGRGEGGLANRFILVANTEAADGGATIVAGNERVIRARLADASFYDDDRPPDAARGPPAEIRSNIGFHESSARRASVSSASKRLAEELAPL